MLAAGEEFLEKGYESASIEGVARRASAGKMTVYRHFRDKHALFHELVLRNAHRTQVQLSFLDADTRSPEMALLEAAQRIQEVSAAPENIALLRVVISESQRLPGLASELLSVQEESIRPLKNYLIRMRASRVLVAHDPDVLARMFFRMVVETYRVFMGAHGTARSRRAAHAELLQVSVAVFLQGTLRRPRFR